MASEHQAPFCIIISADDFLLFFPFNPQVMDASTALAVAEKALELVNAGKPLPHVERLPR